MTEPNHPNSNHVMIVGGGVAGLGAAWELRGRGRWRRAPAGH